MALREALIIPLMLPHLFGQKARKSWGGILLYGPPGTGKSMLAEAVAQSMPGEVNFIAVTAGDLKNKYVGETEQRIQALFKVAKDNAPCIIFIDEVDSIIRSRKKGNDEKDYNRSMKTELLVQMEGIGSSSKVIVLAATNLPFELDEAFRRRCQKR